MYTHEAVFLSLFAFVLLVLCAYGLHRYQLVYLYYRYRKNQPQLRASFLHLPQVTIQLPMYNERYVARRIIETACRIDYPRERLEIQVLDDSTDDTTLIARRTVEDMLRAGHNVVYLHRDRRLGFKAGALAEGLKVAAGEFICIFDADFVPPPDILQQTIHYFVDPKVGMVQARWEHLNRDHSLLTKTQAILLDGHFVIEHTARSRSGRFMSFNGTAGLWRKSCIIDSGGWQHDTLTEDLDLSYRAQLRGWKFLHLPNLVTPAELPPEMPAFKAQQHRWTKGGAQTCRKLLPRILRSRLPWKIKLEAFFHLTSCTTYFFILALSLMLFPALLIKLQVTGTHRLAGFLFDSALLVIATCSAGSFYVASQREVFRSWSDSLKYLPFLMSLGIGIALNNAVAALEGFFGRPGDFVRTPKYGVSASSDQTWRGRHRHSRHPTGLNWQPFAELSLGLYMWACIAACLYYGHVVAGVPFLALFAVGHCYVALSTLLAPYFAAWGRSEAEPAAGTKWPVPS